MIHHIYTYTFWYYKVTSLYELCNTFKINKYDFYFRFFHFEIVIIIKKKLALYSGVATPLGPGGGGGLAAPIFPRI